MVLGKRRWFGKAAMEPNNIPFTVLGAGLLWMGWFGFNGGSALAANGLAINAIVTTNTAAAAAAIVWMFLSWRDNKPSVLGIVTGAVVGLVAITPAAGFVTPLAAIFIGAIAAPISYFAMRLRVKRIQAAAALAAIVFAFGMTFLLTKVLHRFMGLRVTDNEEEVGLDISEHGERAYA
jgi:Amt family ammonium transporter